MKTPTLLRHVSLVIVACLFCVLNTGCLIDWAIGEKQTETETQPVKPEQQHPNCPGGRCPAGDLPTGDLPVGSTALITAGDCLPCDTVTRPVAYRPPASVNTDLFVGMHDSVQTVAAKDELKTGSYTCRRCGRATVGDQWHELRTANGDSMLLMCQPCFDKTTATERRQVLESLLRSSGHADTAIALRLREAL